MVRRAPGNRVALDVAKQFGEVYCQTMVQALIGRDLKELRVMTSVRDRT